MIGLIIIIVISFGVGLYVRDWPIIKMDYEFKITDVINIGISIIIAILVPFFIKYFVERGNKVNQIVIDEIIRYRNHLDLIQERFLNFYQSNSLTSQNKTEISILYEILDSKIQILEEVINNTCKSRNSSALINELKQKHIELWRTLTGVRINNSLITAISPSTFSTGVRQHQEVVDVIVKINLMLSEL